MYVWECYKILDLNTHWQPRFMCHFGQRIRGAGAWGFRGGADTLQVDGKHILAAQLRNSETQRGVPPSLSVPLNSNRLRWTRWLPSWTWVFCRNSCKPARGRPKASFWVFCLITSFKSVSQKAHFGVAKPWSSSVLKISCKSWSYILVLFEELNEIVKKWVTDNYVH